MKRTLYFIIPLLNVMHIHAEDELKKMYTTHCTQTSDIYEHIPVLKKLAQECSSVIEIGLRDMNSTWGVLQGLSENKSPIRLYIGIDLSYPPLNTLNMAKRLAQEHDITFRFWQINDMDIHIEDFPKIDLLFIDSLHTYCHATYELEKFCDSVLKYIAMHDTDEPWGFIDDFQQYSGDYSEYPVWIDRTRKGLWAAVEDFLSRHPEWVLHEKRTNNHGFTILKRVSQ